MAGCADRAEAADRRSRSRQRPAGQLRGTTRPALHRRSQGDLSVSLHIEALRAIVLGRPRSERTHRFSRTFSTLTRTCGVPDGQAGRALSCSPINSSTRSFGSIAPRSTSCAEATGSGSTEEPAPVAASGRRPPLEVRSREWDEWSISAVGSESSRPLIFSPDGESKSLHDASQVPSSVHTGLVLFTALLAFWPAASAYADAYTGSGVVQVKERPTQDGLKPPGGGGATTQSAPANGTFCCSVPYAAVQASPVASWLATVRRTRSSAVS